MKDKLFYVYFFFIKFWLHAVDKVVIFYGWMTHRPTGCMHFSNCRVFWEQNWSYIHNFFYSLAVCRISFFALPRTHSIDRMWTFFIELRERLWWWFMGRAVKQIWPIIAKMGSCLIHSLHYFQYIYIKGMPDKIMWCAHSLMILISLIDLTITRCFCYFNVLNRDYWLNETMRVISISMMMIFRLIGVEWYHLKMYARTCAT